MTQNAQIALMLARFARPSWWASAEDAKRRYDQAANRLYLAGQLWERCLDRKHGDLEGARAEHQAAMHDVFVAGRELRASTAPKQEVLVRGTQSMEGP